MDCIDHFEFKGYNLPLNLSKYIKGGSIVKGCVRKLHYSSSNICDGSSHLECIFSWVVASLLLVIVAQGFAVWFLAKKLRKPTPSAPEVEIELERQVEVPIQPTHRAKHGSVYPKLAATAGVVYLANGMLDMASVVGVDGCSQVYPMGDVFETCTDGSCIKQWVYTLDINNGDEICVPTPKGLLSLGTFSVIASSAPDFSLESSEWELGVHVKRSCYSQGVCKYCSPRETNLTWPTNTRYQTSGCFSKCGCVSCGCVSCEQSCLFWRATVKPVGARFNVERYSDFSYGVSVKDGINHRILGQGSTMDTPLGKISLRSLSPHPVGKVCLKQDKMLDTENCRPNMAGPYALTFDGDDILFDVTKIHCHSPTTETVRCTVADTDKDMELFSLPHYRSGYVFEKQKYGIEATYRKPLSISIHLLREFPLPLKFVSDNSSCVTAHYENHGCFNCEEGFVVLLTMQGHGHCYFKHDGLMIPSTLVSCDGSSYLHGFTRKHKLPDLLVCGQVLSFEGQLSPPKVMAEDGSWSGTSESSSSWWEPLFSLQSFSLKTTLTTLLTCFAGFLGLKIFLMLKQAIRG